ncbi:centrosomal protein of 126 kDa isoform X2 [Denticeps clupeoides]|uniref:centrosomal protein of 126 kDa isoform X2 n=1 Tax=Denticeps clupeoides TaxID=299321 RepID=UPI0010A55BA0|nr:centrosomal protein of 126 kDa isoform X2 [Denticeps clupeoides]
MHAWKENLFCSIIRADYEGGLEDERQLLAEEQKSSRARARKFSMETNRRRRALEERRKLCDVQEQRRRENILLQRKQQVQEATERFQRAHLSPSQRKRPAFRARPPTIDEALSHLQGPFGSQPQQSSFLSSNSSITRNSTPSPKSLVVSNVLNRQRALSAAEAYTKLLQERSFNYAKTSQLLSLTELQEAQGLLKDRADSPQDQISHSESLSSLDSLENEEAHLDHMPNSSGCSVSSLDTFDIDDRPLSHQRLQNDQCSSYDVAHGPTKDFLAELLLTPMKENENMPLRDDSAEQRASQPYPAQGTAHCNLKDEPQTQVHCTSLGMLTREGPVGNSGHMTHCGHCDCDHSAQEIATNDKRVVVVPCNSTNPILLEVASSTQEGRADLKQLGQKENKYSRHSPALQIDSPSSKCRQNVVYSAASVISKRGSGSEDPEDQPKETIVTHQTQDRNPDRDTAKHLNKESRNEKFIISDFSNDSSNAKNDMLKSSKTSEEAPKLHSGKMVIYPVSKGADVQFVKGILKKQSKYVAGEAKIMYSPSHLVLARHVASNIRDSIELAKAKGKETESSKAVKKKLRWLDEVKVEERYEEKSSKEPPKQKGMPVGPVYYQSTPADHQQDLCQRTCGTVTLRANNVTPSTPACSQSTRQAWADVGVQESSMQEPTEVEVKAPRVSVRTGGHRVPRRVCSARAGTGSVFSRVRKGTIIRPQSATEAKHVTKTQGKVMVPRPPPRTETVEGSTWEAAVYIAKTKAGLPTEPALYKDNSDSQAVAAHEGAIIVPLPPSHAHPSRETVSKAMAAISQQDSPGGAVRRGIMCVENGLCLDQTPTDDEISQLWHSVRSALSSKDGIPQNLQTQNGLLSVLPQTRTNMSHVNTNGASLISGVKPITRMGGFFLSPSNARVVARRGSPEASGGRGVGFVDLVRQNPRTGRRKPPLPSQAAALITAFAGKTEQAVQNEGPESLGPVPDTEPQAAAGPVQPRGQCLSTLSLEELKVLQSLERLNHRLQYMEEVAGDIPNVKSVLHTEATYNLSSRLGEVAGTAPRRHCTVSANGSHSQTVRR